MAGVFGLHTSTLQRPCTHIQALPSLRQIPCLPAVRKPLLRGERATTGSTSWPLRAATLEAPSVETQTSSIERLPQTDKYAVVDLGGTQLLVEEGRWYTCNRLQAEPGSRLQLGRVLALKDEGVFTVGKPYLESVVVEAEVLEDAKGPKLTIFKYRAKKHYRKKTGHRQPLTKFLVTKIDKQ